MRASVTLKGPSGDAPSPVIVFSIADIAPHVGRKRCINVDCPKEFGCYLAAPLTR